MPCARSSARDVLFVVPHATRRAEVCGLLLPFEVEVREFGGTATRSLSTGSRVVWCSWVMYPNDTSSLILGFSPDVRWLNLSYVSLAPQEARCVSDKPRYWQISLMALETASSKVKPSVPAGRGLTLTKKVLGLPVLLFVWRFSRTTCTKPISRHQSSLGLYRMPLDFGQRRMTPRTAIGHSHPSDVRVPCTFANSRMRNANCKSSCSTGKQCLPANSAIESTSSAPNALGTGVACDPR